MNLQEMQVSQLADLSYNQLINENSLSTTCFGYLYKLFHHMKI